MKNRGLTTHAISPTYASLVPLVVSGFGNSVGPHSLECHGSVRAGECDVDEEPLAGGEDRVFMMMATWPAGAPAGVLESVDAIIGSVHALPTGVPRALAFRISREGAASSELRFFSSEAAAGLRPRLRITYFPRKEFALP